MNSLFRNVIVRGRDTLLKEALETQLAGCVKDVQINHALGAQFGSSAEAIEGLCTTLEAIFIHGVKETLVDRVSMAMGDPDTRPEPNFWPALLVFSHRDLIDQIGRLSFICCDVGRCRAWLRIALNESLLASYLQSMMAQNSALHTFYRRGAYLRDRERLDTLVTLVSGLETQSFKLACNSSLLNTWPSQSLILAGVWSPAMKASPVTSGMDVASAIVNDVPSRAEDAISAKSSIYESPVGSSSGFDEDEALKIILGGKPQDTLEPYTTSQPETNFLRADESPVKCDSPIGTEPSIVITKPSEDNVFEEVKEPSSSKGETSILGTSVKKETEFLSTETENSGKKKLQSYHSLVESYNQTSTNSSKLPDLQDLLQKFQNRSGDSSPVISPSSVNENEMAETLNYEVVLNSFSPPDIPEFGMLIQYIARLPHEPGLDSQNYSCPSCFDPIGLNFGPARVCGLTGVYYCSTCFGDCTQCHWVVPARIIYNWDFRRFPVSKKAGDFLSQIQLYPLFDLSAINPKIYGAVDELVRLKELRVRLGFLREYLSTCRGNAMEALQRQLWPRDYLYEKLHHYSLSDLLQVPSGALETSLKSAVALARDHVLSCVLCSQKGFICEICRSTEVIFPFDLETTYRCNACSAVYHFECLQAGQLCPKCLRIKERELSGRSNSTVASSSSLS